jgi:uncharacterized protein
MARWISFAVFLLVAVSVLGGMHYYLWARLIRDVGLSGPVKRGLTWLLCGLGASIPLAMATSRLVSPQWSVWWVKPAYFWIGISFLLLIAVLLFDLLRGGYNAVSLLGGGTSPERRQVLARFGGLAAAVLGLGASGWAIREAAKVTIKRVEVTLAKLPKELDGTTIVQLSDVHVGPTIGREFIEELVRTVNGLAPDVVAITGDLVDGRVSDLKHHVAPLADIRSTHGTFFVTGNHEYYSGAAEWCEHLSTELGVRVLHNEHVSVGRDGHTFHLAGIHDYQSARFDEGHSPDLNKAVAGRDTDRALVLLAHQPKAIHEAVKHGVDLQLSGHTHGGQLWPFNWLVRLEQPVVAGLAKFGETLIYVSRGTGYWGPPMRLNAPPEVTYIKLRSV